MDDHADVKPASVMLALGSNMGDRLAVLRAAATALESFVTVTARSSVYETAAVYVPDQPHYLNAVLAGITRLSPLALLWNIKQLETELGRQPTFRYGPRSVDIDILFYDDLIMTTPELTIPHARLTEREFVLRPLTDIAPHFKHPQNGQTVAEMLGRMPSLNPINLGPL